MCGVFGGALRLQKGFGGVWGALEIGSGWEGHWVSIGGPEEVYRAWGDGTGLYGCWGMPVEVVGGPGRSLGGPLGFGGSLTVRGSVGCFGRPRKGLGGLWGLGSL